MSELALQEWSRDAYVISTDPSKLDHHVIHEYLCFESYWAKGRPQEITERVIAHSLPFGMYEGVEQVGFARVVTDYGAFGYIADVFVLEAYQGRGLGKWLMECILDHPAVRHLKRWHLATNDAHGLYEQYGFTRPGEPMRHMEKINPDAYRLAMEATSDG